MLLALLLLWLAFFTGHYEQSLTSVAVGSALVVISQSALFALFCLYGLSGYGVYLWRKSKGKPTSVISTSTDEPDERGLHD